MIIIRIRVINRRLNNPEKESTNLLENPPKITFKRLMETIWELLTKWELEILGLSPFERFVTLKLELVH
jgi:hypothetical protein